MEGKVNKFRYNIWSVFRIVRNSITRLERYL